MTLNKLIASCPCGGLVAVVNLYINDDKCLLTIGICTACNESIKTAWPLTELFKNCPKSDAEPLRKPVRPPLNTDADFLHSLGISEGGNDDLS